METKDNTPKEKVSFYTSVKRDLFAWLQALVFALFGLIFCFTFFGRLIAVEGESMYPTLHDRDMLLVRSIREIAPQIFGWLDLLDINVIVILLLMVSVSGFTMISGLLILILERTNMIGILKALGQANASIRKIFLYLSFFLIGRGMLWGNAVGLALCFLQKQFQIIKLDASVYYLASVPIDLNVWMLILLNIGTLAVTMALMIAPSYLVTRIDPVKAIRFE